MLKHIFTYNKEFPLESGASLPEVEIVYYTSHPSHKGKRVVWICHALTANANPEEWWDTLVGPGKYLDTKRDFIICANILASCYGTTGPQSINPATNHPYLCSFPVVSIRDMVKAHELLRESLGIESIDLLIGGSSGGFQSLEWAISNPLLIKNLCLIACNARISPWGTALNESQRMALYADPSFCRDTQVPVSIGDVVGDIAASGGQKGLECARSIALISYRSYGGYGQTQAEQDEDVFLASRACTYQQHQGEKLSKRFNAYSYYYLTLSLDTHNVGRGRGGVERALSLIRANTLCIAIDSDVLFPVSELEYLATHIPNAIYRTIPSTFGHDGFLLEYEKLSDLLAEHRELYLQKN
ncbi:homoserine O-acetyltransferase [Bacteroidia bacterium]|nr:homoserine O-acetyltransferase [Bacteroidia bacterium]